MDIQRAILLEKTKESSDTAVVFLPGISGKAHGERFDGLVSTVHAVGYDIARVDLWGPERDVNTLSYQLLFDDLDVVVAELTSKGYQKIILIGKSFGGGVVLAYENTIVVQKIMWAPAIGVNDGSGNFASFISQPFSDNADLLKVELGKEYIAHQGMPLGIVHGTADDVVPPSNSELIRNLASNATVISIPNADHSFKTEVHEQQLLEATSQLLKQKL